MIKRLLTLFHHDLRHGGWQYALATATEFLTRALRGRGHNTRPRPLRVKGFASPVWYRPRTSDLKVIRQVLLRGELQACASLPDVRHIVDCGANIGTASLWLLERFPAARISVVEPDAGNLAVCRKNLEPFAHRVTFHQAGIWSECAPLVVDRTCGLGEEYEFRVRPAAPGETPEVDGIDLPTLLDRDRIDRADLIKMDIELAEEQVLAHHPERWLRRTANLVIELHTPAAHTALKRALADFDHHLSQTGEYVAATQITPRPAPTLTHLAPPPPSKTPAPTPTS